MIPRSRFSGTELKEVSFVELGNTDGSTNLEKEIKSCVWDLVSLTGQLDIQMEIPYEAVSKGTVKFKDRYLEIIRILMVFKAMRHRRSPRKSL